MTDKRNQDPSWARYNGTLTLPGEKEVRNIGLFFDRVCKAVTIQFDEPVAGSSKWKAASVEIAKRLKYYEVVFKTIGLPKETVELTWKCNASLEDGTMAGVVKARPNEQRISGEKGFILGEQCTKVTESSEAPS